MFVPGAGALKFKSRIGQIGHVVVAYGSPPLRHFSERNCVAYRCNDAEMESANSVNASG